MNSLAPRRTLPLFALLLLALSALAQPRQPVDGAIYLGTTERGRTLIVSLHLYPPDGAELQLLEAPAGPGEEPSVELTLTGPYLEHQRELEISTETWTFIADRLPDGPLDSLGEAELYLYEFEPIELRAVGTVILGGLRSADGSFAVQRWAPFLYSEPWDAISFDVSVDETAREGLEQRRELPDTPGGTFTESRMVYLTAFDRDLVSYYTLIDIYTGGAHPNNWRETTTLLSNGGGSWILVDDACEAAARLDWECNEASLRRQVIDDLRSQGAALVEEDVVNRQTEWLLDAFVLTPAGVRFLLDPYEVGPYVQGPFEVDLPYGRLAD